SMTLFAHAADDKRDFSEALARFCGGEGDPLTGELLAARAEPRRT
ncbi:MAG: DUF1810 family protein, partial [Gammaproteobacteria bacterium]|nr:DUF1810 family protein [Gammaproteobacteria bacterium]